MDIVAPPSVRDNGCTVLHCRRDPVLANARSGNAAMLATAGGGDHSVGRVSGGTAPAGSVANLCSRLLRYCDPNNAGDRGADPGTHHRTDRDEGRDAYYSTRRNTRANAHANGAADSYSGANHYTDGDAGPHRNPRPHIYCRTHP